MASWSIGSWNDARIWLVKWSAVLTGILFVFFVIAPFVALPFRGDQSKQALGIIAPVFFGYLGLATTFLFQAPPKIPASPINPLFSLIVKAPVGIFSVGLFVLILTYCLTNILAKKIGDGMGFDDFVFYLSMLLTLQSGTTGVLFAAIFGKHET
jgi:hypothetical protein